MIWSLWSYRMYFLCICDWDCIQCNCCTFWFSLIWLFSTKLIFMLGFLWTTSSLNIWGVEAKPLPLRAYLHTNLFTVPPSPSVIPLPQDLAKKCQCISQLSFIFHRWRFEKRNLCQLGPCGKTFICSKSGYFSMSIKTILVMNV